MTCKIFISGLLFLICHHAVSQKTLHYNLAGLLKKNKILTTDSSGTSILNNDKPGAISTVNTVWFKEIRFSEGTIDIDLRGKNEFLRSFLGIAFHGADSNTYDVLYFRPFNFSHADTARRHWSVQYVSLPDFHWPRLRKEHPLVYESKVDPVPDADSWFHATIIIKDGILKVFVNHSAHASLEVALLNDRKDGSFGLFSDGLRSDFANLAITPSAVKPTVDHRYNLPEALQKGWFEFESRSRMQAAGINKEAVQLIRLASLKNVKFSNGTIEADLKGRDLVGQSFLGIAFNVKDSSHYEVVYFRPFNFNATDSVRKKHAVQYMCMPAYPWDRLRKEFPDAYEAEIKPAPAAEDWFHIKITVQNEWITVYVNQSPVPSLQVRSLCTLKTGIIGLWSDAEIQNSEFANLNISQ
jgi:hypothetical protein